MNEYSSVIYIAVNYASSTLLAQLLDAWVKFRVVEKIYVVDCYSSFEEIVNLEVLKAKFNFNLIKIDNVGYGEGLNYGIQQVLIDYRESPDFEHKLILFGNVDVYPKSINLVCESFASVPVINIFENNKPKNPFLTELQNNYIKIAYWAAKFNSILLLYMWILVSKLVKKIKSKTYAVHGSLFALTGSQLRQLNPIFSYKVFLYCEELFFAKSVRDVGWTYSNSAVDVVHIGGVATNKTIKLNRGVFFQNWRKSMLEYFKIVSR